MKKLVWISVLSLALVSFALPSLMPTHSYAAAESTEAPTYAEGASVYASEAVDGKELVGFNADDRREVAGLVRTMSLYIYFDALESGELSADEEIGVSLKAQKTGGNKMFLDARNKYKVSDLLRGAVIASANDACVALAERLCNDEGVFTQRMNALAQEWNLSNTRFVNCTGIAAQEPQYSTARDINFITRKLLTKSAFAELASIWMEDFTHPDGRVTGLASSNKLIKQYKGSIGGVTGYNPTSAFCLSAAAARGDLSVVVTVLGARDGKSRFADAASTFNAVFSEYGYKVVCRGGEKIEALLPVSGGTVKSISAAPSRDLAVLVKKGDTEAQVRYELPDVVKAPIKCGDVVGKAIIAYGDVETEVSLLACEDAPEAEYWDYLKDIAGKW